MFKNIGGLIKGVASGLTVLGIVFSVIVGLSMIRVSFLVGLCVMIIGGIASWLANIVLYGFGELIDNTRDIKTQLVKCNDNRDKMDRS